MGIPLWKSVCFFAAIFWISLRLFPSDREMGFFYSQSEVFDSARFYLAKQFYRDPGDRANTLRYLRVLAQSGDDELFELTVSKMLARDSRDSVIHLMAAQFHESRMQLEDASEHWKTVVEFDPRQRDIRDKLVSYYVLRKDISSLIDLYQAEIRRGAAPLDFYYDLARLYGLRHEVERAESVYLEILNAHPGEAAAKLRLIEIYEFRHNPEAVMDLSRRLVQENPDQESYVLNLAEVLIRYNHLDEASEFIKRALVKFKNRSDFVRLMVDLEIRSGHRAEAMKLLEELRATNQGGPVILKTMGELYYEMGDDAKAMEFLKEYHAKTGGDYHTHHVLGDVLTKRGDPSGGRREYEEALRLLRG